MTCLDKVIKLSRTECECFEDDKPVDYNEGQSEIYLDELQGLSLEVLSGVQNCEQGNIWFMMDRARTNATEQFAADILSGMEMMFMNRRPNYSGVIGDTAFTATLNLTTNKAGVKIKPWDIIGGYYDLKRIGLMFNTTSPITIKVFSSEDTVNEIASYNMTTAANVLQFVALTDPLRLPLWSNNSSYIEYYIVYDLTGAYLPKNNALDCGCGKASPKVSFKNWITLEGITGNVGTEYNSYPATQQLNGLVIDGSFTCDSSRLICSDEYPLDFNTGRAKQIAYAIRFKTAEMLIQKILDSPEINRYTILGREALYGKRASYSKKYEEWVEYLVTYTEILNSDCLMCRPNPNFSKGHIFS